MSRGGWRSKPVSQPDALLDRCLRWLGPRKPAAGRLRAMVTAMQAAGLGPATINRHFSALRKHWPGLAVPWQREPRGRTRWPSPAEVDAIVAACRDPRVAAMIRFLYATGMRCGEAFELRPGDVGTAEAVVRRSKNGDSRVVALNRSALAAWERGWAGLGRSRFQHEFRRACELVGITDVVPHSLRHGAASRLVGAGVSLPVVQALLGHRDFRSTLRYTHVTSHALQQAVERLDAEATGSGTGCESALGST